MSSRSNPRSIRLSPKSLLEKKVCVKIRLYNTYLEGILSAFDSYSNILLTDVVEYVKDQETGDLVEKERHGSVLLRGDSIITLSER